MLKTRLNKLEKILRPKVKPEAFLMCYVFRDGTCEHEGQKFANKEEFVKATNAKNIIYYMSFADSVGLAEKPERVII